jgi:hypothetical protein
MPTLPSFYSSEHFPTKLTLSTFINEKNKKPFGTDKKLRKIEDKVIKGTDCVQKTLF